MLKIKFFSLRLTIIFFFSFSLFATEDKNPKAWTIDDILNQESTGSFDISPSGEWVVWVKSRPAKKENKKIGDIYLTSLVDSTQVQLTRGKFYDRSPKWSPDGKMMAFLSSREKEKGTQIWLMNSLGGGPWILIDLKKNGVNSFEWRTEKSIIFSARENPTNYEQELKKKKDSPLALEFKKRKIATVVGYYGKKKKGLLIPEVVQVNDSLTVGRFEVTRAQYMVFNHHIVYPYGTDNFPINDISFKQAKKYCRWLSNASGKNYDLPTVEEMKLLFSKNKSNKKNENTLGYWAGYSLNPDEAAELDVKIAELELSGLLLMEVGSRKPASDDLLIFDISGNVSEWCIGEDGDGIILGASAVTSTDSKGEYEAPRKEYVGFRVVLRK